MHIDVISTIATADLPSAELADYLQLQSDPTGEVRQNQHLDSSLRAAIIEVETRTQHALLAKKMEASGVTSSRLSLPFGKTDRIQIHQVFIEDNPRQILEQSDYSFKVERTHCEINLSHSVSTMWGVQFDVGQTHWDDVQGDLQMAVIMLAAHFYENRFNTTQQNFSIPKLVETIIEKHRAIRIFRGS